MKSVRVVPFVLAALVGCSSAPVDLGSPGRNQSPQERGGDNVLGDKDGDETVRESPGPENPTPSAGEPETVVEMTSLGGVSQIRDLDLAAGKIHYSALANDRVALYRYDIASKANVAVGDEFASEPFAADANGVFYSGVRAEPASRAIFGTPTTGIAPEWLSLVPTYATAVGLDDQKVYWIERGELTTNFRVAHRGAFSSSPEPTQSYGPEMSLGANFFRHIVVDQGVAYAAGDHGMLVKFDIELATTMLAEQGPTNGFVVGGTNLYWMDGAALRSLPKTATKETLPSTIATLPADANNVVAGVGPKGIYVLSETTTGSDAGSVIRVDPTSGAQKELATNLSGLGRGVFRENTLYFTTKKGILRLADQ